MADKKNATKQLPPGTKASGKKGGTWDSLDLLPSVTNVIKNVLNFTSMTPVQSATIPNFLEHKDVAVEAPTGSGKTIAFVVPILERLLRLPSPLKKSEVGAMVITPTRELAHQICEVFHSFLDTINAELPEEDPKRLSVWRLTGGSDEGEDMKFLRTHGGHIIVATPGRLEHTLKKVPDLRLKTLEVLVLDEADSLLEMGFEASISSILNRLPKQRRTGLFSATMTKKVTNLVKAGMRNPVKIGVQVQSTPATSVPTDRFQASASSVKHSSTAPTQVTPTTLSNHYLLIEADAKLSFLVHFLQTLAKQASENDGAGCKVIIFFATIASVKYFRSVLTHFKVLPESIPVLGTHSDVPQKKREQIRQTFTEQRAAVLLSTDVTARGVDIPDVDWVIQFDPPKDPDDFIHRSGRTARNGRSGNALLFLLPSEESYLELMTQKGVPLSSFPATSDLFSITIDPSKLKSADWREEIEDQNSMDTDGIGNNNPESSTTSTTKLTEDDDDRPNYVLKRIPKPVEIASHTHPYLKGMTDYTPKLRQLSCSDRAMMDAGILAFISFVAAYKEHKASFSFRLSQLDFGALAKLFGLLKLPRMVEFAPSKVQNFEPMDIDLESIKYADKKREKDRQARIQKDAAAAAEASAPSKGGRKFGFSAEDFGKTSDAEESEEAEEEESSSSEELDDFASEAALLKKLKRRKISEATYERLTGNNDLDAEIGGGAASRGNGQHNKPNHKKRNFSGPRDGDGNASSSLSKHKKFKKR